MKISKLENHPKQFIVIADGPDGKSTYEECWGSHAKYSFRAIGSYDNLAEAVLTASQFAGRRILDRKTGRLVGKKRILETANI